MASPERNAEIGRQLALIDQVKTLLRDALDTLEETEAQRSALLKAAKEAEERLAQLIAIERTDEMLTLSAGHLTGIRMVLNSAIALAEGQPREEGEHGTK